MASLDDLVSTAKGAVQNLGQIAQNLLKVFPRISGTFTLTNATATVVAQTAIAANGVVTWNPTNAAASALLRNRGLFTQSVTSGVGFTVSTDNGTAAGTETFTYIALNPS
jgi:hypothetical protein